jgi:hypothetical protein
MRFLRREEAAECPLVMGTAAGNAFALLITLISVPTATAVCAVAQDGASPLR